MGKGEEEEGKKKRKEEEEGGSKVDPSLKSSRISSSYSRALAQRSWEAHASRTGYTPKPGGSSNMGCGRNQTGGILLIQLSETLRTAAGAEPAAWRLGQQQITLLS